MLPTCGKCSHYFVTHDKARPWGCRKFGFKSHRLPSVEVKNSTGIDCAYYRSKRLKSTPEREPHGK
ncbi:MAG: hypothetical protein EBW42_09555 [Rhodobacterales bacterium]|nr:hypothetical protein [Rhodobacterales bacterium]